MLSDLAVVVVSYNTKRLIAECLTSVFASLERSNLAADVYVIDNASSDGTPEMIATRFPQVNLIASDTNLGFAAANNLVLRKLGWSNDLPVPENLRDLKILFLNPDTVVLDDAIAHIYNFLKSNPDVGMAGVQLLHSDGGFQHSGFHFPSLAQVFFDFYPVHHRLTGSWLNGRYPKRLCDKGDPFEIDHPLGAVMMVPGEALASVGAMDEGFFMYCEEIDWAFRLKRAGWRIFCVPRARIVHHVAQSTQQFKDSMFIELWRSRFRLFEKHYSRTYRWLVRRIVRFSLRRRIVQLIRDDACVADSESRIRAYREVIRM